MDPRLVRVLQVAVGIGGAVVASIWLRETELYGLIMSVAGGFIGNTFTGPGHVDVKQLERLRPPSDPPPRP